jgi:hypothetical protein
MNVFEWHHVVGVRRGGELYVYVDGIEYGPNNYRYAGNYITSTTDISSNTPIRLAEHGAWAQYHSGTIDEVKIYDRALSAEEILAQYTSGKFAIQTRTVTLASGASTTLTLTWNTTGVPCGKYTISAYATPVPGETDLGDNTYTGGWVEVRLRGLVTPPTPTHTKVTLADFGKLKLIYSQVYPYKCPPYDVNNPETYYYMPSVVTGKPEYLMPDINGDGKVKFADVGLEKLIYSGKA